MKSATQSYNYGPGSPLAGGKGSQRRIGYRGRLYDDAAGRAEAYGNFGSLAGFYDLQRTGATQHEKLQRDAAVQIAGQKTAVSDEFKAFGRRVPGENNGFTASEMNPLATQPDEVRLIAKKGQAKPQLDPVIAALIGFGLKEASKEGGGRFMPGEFAAINKSINDNMLAGRPTSPEVLNKSFETIAAREVAPIKGSQGVTESMVPGTTKSIPNRTGITLPGQIEKAAEAAGGPRRPHVMEGDKPFSRGRFSGGFIDPAQPRVSQTIPQQPREAAKKEAETNQSQIPEGYEANQKVFRAEQFLRELLDTGHEAISTDPNIPHYSPGSITKEQGVASLPLDAPEVDYLLSKTGRGSHAESFNPMKPANKLYPSASSRMNNPNWRPKGYAEGEPGMTDQQQREAAAFASLPPALRDAMANSAVKKSEPFVEAARTASGAIEAVSGMGGVGKIAESFTPYIVGEIGKEMMIPTSGRDIVLANKNSQPFMAGLNDQAAQAGTQIVQEAGRPSITTPVAPLEDNPDDDAARRMRDMAEKLTASLTDPNKNVPPAIPDKALVPGSGMFDRFKAEDANDTSKDTQVYTPHPLFGPLEQLSDSRTAAHQNYKSIMRQAEVDAQAGRPISPLAQAEYARQQAFTDNAHAGQVARYKAWEDRKKEDVGLLKNLMTQSRTAAASAERENTVRQIANKNIALREDAARQKRSNDIMIQNGVDPKSIAAHRKQYDSAAGDIAGFMAAYRRQQIPKGTDPEQAKKIEAAVKGAEAGLIGLLKEGKFAEVAAEIRTRPIEFTSDDGKKYVYLGGKVTAMTDREDIIYKTTAKGERIPYVRNRTTKEITRLETPDEVKKSTNLPFSTGQRGRP